MQQYLQSMYIHNRALYTNNCQINIYSLFVFPQSSLRCIDETEQLRFHVIALRGEAREKLPLSGFLKKCHIYRATKLHCDSQM